MLRLRRPAGFVALALMLLGIAASAGASLAWGDCCAGMPAERGASDPAAPCHSVAPTSCCEPVASARIPMPSGAPALAALVMAFPAAQDPCVSRAGIATPAAPRDAARACVVLRL